MDHGELVGLLPLNRTNSMNPFSCDEVRFLQLAIPHISHGLKAALLVDSSMSEEEHFRAAANCGVGVVLIDESGRVLALNDCARSIFHQIGVFDDLPADAFAATQVKSSLTYIASVLKAVFFGNGEFWSNAMSPATRIFSHHTGIALKLRGYLADGNTDERYFTVIVEQGETEEHRHRRTMHRFGLSLREVELLDLMAARYSSKEIALKMSIGTETVRTYLKRMIDKLDLIGYHGLLVFATKLALPLQPERLREP
jgi:DNA-binding CsgD family transcriptional regulator